MNLRRVIRWVWFVVCGVGWLSGVSVWADGKAFPPVAVATDLRMPDQQAILAWDAGVERLAIETRVEGAASEFAWVVPLPAVPRVEAGTSGLFETIAFQTRPRVVHRGGRVFGGVLAVCGLVWFVLIARGPRPVPWPGLVTLPATAAGVFLLVDDAPGVLLGLGTFAILTLVLRRVGAGRRWVLDTMLLVGLLGLLAGMFLPALDTAGVGPGGTASGAADVEVLAREQAGVFETTTIASKDPAALAGWLRTNGFRLPASAEPVIAEHVRDGWVFAASRVRRDVATSGVVSLHPLVFTFPAKEPVYPLRLTGVDNGPLAVELFVLGPERAAVDGFEVRDVRPVAYPTVVPTEKRRLDPEVLQMAHTGLKGLAPKAAIATRLRATLTPDRMREDARVRWVGMQEHRSRLYSRQGALLHVLDWVGSGALGVLTLVRLAGLRLPSVTRRRVAIQSGVGIAALGLAVLRYATVPVTEVRLEHRFERILFPNRLRAAIDHAIHQALPTNTPPTVGAVRAAVREALGRDPRLRHVREIDAPRNYVVRATATGVEVVCFDDYGGEIPVVYGKD